MPATPGGQAPLRGVETDRTGHQAPRAGGRRSAGERSGLAFARDARDEMEERVRKRLGAAEARDVTVRTFHSLGMAIIGKAEGKRPTLARTAESDRALFDLLKGIVADLLADGGRVGDLAEMVPGRLCAVQERT